MSLHLIVGTLQNTKQDITWKKIKTIIINSSSAIYMMKASLSQYSSIILGKYSWWNWHEPMGGNLECSLRANITRLVIDELKQICGFYSYSYRVRSYMLNNIQSSDGSYFGCLAYVWFWSVLTWSIPVYSWIYWLHIITIVMNLLNLPWQEWDSLSVICSSLVIFFNYPVS